VVVVGVTVFLFGFCVMAQRFEFCFLPIKTDTPKQKAMGCIG
jgi:hypothetical protein